MTLKERYCQHIITDKSLRNLAKRLMPQHHEDLLQHLALIICEMSETQTERIQPYFNFWCVRTMINSAGRWGHVGKYAADTTCTLTQDVIDAIEEQTDLVPLTNLYWYDYELLKLYAELGTTRAVSQRLGIPLTSIKRDIAEAKLKARELLERNM